ncbi:MAG: tetratricopeptide repeat protein [Acidimicrobiia bacterium]|nr:tetratricopeptide repeat protein [Acidimicrobiia bacterium]
MTLLNPSWPANRRVLCWWILGVSALTVFRILTLANSQASNATSISADQHYQRGADLVKRGDWDNAAGEFQAALRLKPEHAEAHCDLGVVLDLIGESQLALQELRLALRYRPRFGLAQFNLASLLKRQGKTREAQEAFGLAEEFLREASTQGRDSSTEKVLLAGTLWELQRSQEAKEILARTLETSPRLASALRLLGRIHFSEKDFPQAIQAFAACIAAQPRVFDDHLWLIKTYRENGDRQAAFRSATRLLEEFSNEPLAFYTAGEEYEQAGQLELAAAHYRRAIALWEKRPRSRLQHVQDGRIRLARVLANQDDLAGARSLLERIVAESPRSWQAQSELGALLLKLKDYAPAAAALQRAAELEPDHRETRLQLGTALLRLGRQEEAAQHLKIADQIQNTKDAHTFRQLGLAALNRGDFSEAEAEFQKALRLIPNSSEPQTDLALAYYARGDVGRSADHFRMALKQNPSNVKALNGLGAVLDSSGKGEEARRCFEQAVRLEPENWDAVYNLARTLLRMNQLGEAAAHFEKLLSRQSRHPEAHYLYGVLFEKRQLLDEAVAQYRQAVTQDPKMWVAHERLAHVLKGRGEPDLAAHHLKKAQEIKSRTSR